MSATISVLYFASLRESLECEQEALVWSEDIASVQRLIDHLVARRGERWRMLDDRQQVLVAVNQTVADRQCAITEGDEVAFFPPVTGG